MRKLALLFTLAIILPSAALGWMALRSSRNQQLILERQQTLLYQAVADALQKKAESYVAGIQRDFALQVESALASNRIEMAAATFDENIRTNRALASFSVGFAVSRDGKIFSPPMNGSIEGRQFRLQNEKFLANREAVELYTGPLNNASLGIGNNLERGQQSQNMVQTTKRLVSPQKGDSDDGQPFSKIASGEAEFRQAIGDGNQGTIARFLENKLNLLVWYRPPTQPDIIFGAKASLQVIKSELGAIVTNESTEHPELSHNIALALLDDAGKPVTVSRRDFQADWRHPFVATEIGEALPHWELAVYLLHPDQITQSARTLEITLAGLTAIFLCVILVGSWLIFRDLRRQVVLSRQKTDFVSNVSHEFKTPLTSIRMFSELLANGSAHSPEKQQSYLQIISTEASRLTRLINNVLDFSIMDRGEKTYIFEKRNLVEIASNVVHSFRPQLAAGGFTIVESVSETQVEVHVDPDAISQILVNLISNAEKYSGTAREIHLEVAVNSRLQMAEVKVIDRGLGVPQGCEDKIFEQFYRAHDSLASGISGSGLGLTLARQMARAHGGDILYEPNKEGGSCFILRLPMKRNS